MQKYLAGIDLGTTGARCILFDLTGTPVASKYCAYESTSYPKPTWVEQSVDEMLEKTFLACRSVMGENDIKPEQVASIGFSVQRSVTCLIDQDGDVLGNAISWQDTRANDCVEGMRKTSANSGGNVDPDRFYQLSGLPWGPMWLLSKLLWLRENEPQRFAQAVKVVQFSDVVLKAFGADDFYSDHSTTVFYGCWDVAARTWSDELLDLFQLSADLFGKPIAPGKQIATLPLGVAEKTGFAPGTPVAVGAGDQNCATVGMGAIKSGVATVTLGTCGMAILATDKPAEGFGGMMTTNHAIADLWEIEGITNAAASAYQWLRNTVSAELPFSQLNALAENSPVGSRGLLFLPFLATAATPRWNSQARGSLLGMTFAHTKEDVIRAVMEGVTLEIRDVMQRWTQKGYAVDTLRIAGGATRSELWNQIQADVYGKPVETLACDEATCLAAAMFGGVAVGEFKTIDEAVGEMVKVDKLIEPNEKNHAIYEELYDCYSTTYNALNEGEAFSKLAKMQENAEK